MRGKYLKMEYNLYVGIGIFVLGMILYWRIGRKVEVNEYDEKLREIIGGDQYKTKGRFE